MASGLKPGSFFGACAALLEVVPFPVLFVARFVARVNNVNSRFLTEPSALFGMTRS